MSVRTGIKQVKVERPRPLKIGGGTQPQVGVDDLVVVVDSVRRTLSGGGTGESPGASFDVVSQLQTLSANLKLSGAQLESSHKVGNLCMKILLRNLVWLILYIDTQLHVFLN